MLVITGSILTKFPYDFLTNTIFLQIYFQDTKTDRKAFVYIENCEQSLTYAEVSAQTKIEYRAF